MTTGDAVAFHTMRISILGSGTASRELPAHFSAVAQHSAELALTLVNPRLSLFAATAYERLLVDVGYVDAALEAARDGSDAILINSFADYGLNAARAALTVPLIGAGEAALREASADGSRPFSIVTVWPRSMSFLYEERLQATGLQSLCRSIRHASDEHELHKLGHDDGVMPRMARHEPSVIASLRALCEAAVKDDGAAAIVLGCTCMAPIGELLQTGCSVPVIESSRAGLRAALVAGRAAPATAGEAKSIWSGRVSDPTLIPALVSSWTEGGARCAPPPESDCPVCVSATDP
ncbi:MAG: aspartate/glutamate racemase family protein [Nevskiaceae bacterium]